MTEKPTSSITTARNVAFFASGSKSLKPHTWPSELTMHSPEAEATKKT